jgi:hypothetical protein
MEYIIIELIMLVGLTDPTSTVGTVNTLPLPTSLNLIRLEKYFPITSLVYLLLSGCICPQRKREGDLHL